MTDNMRTLAVLATLIAFFGGYLFSNYKHAAATTWHISTKGDTHAHMHHEAIELSGSDAIPDLDLVVHKDQMSGWNIQIVTENFRFAPEHASGEAVAGEGHAHLYIDGKKSARVYGPWFHIAKLAPGDHTIRVTLNANSHQGYVFKGKIIEDMETIVVSK